MYQILRGLEHNIGITRAEQEKMNSTLIDIQGKINRLTGEVENHEKFISQIRAIK